MPYKPYVAFNTDKYHTETAWRVLAELFQKTDRILTGQPVTVSTVQASPIEAPSYTIGDAITFVIKRAGSPVDADNLVALAGANYHELCHVRFTMRDNTHAQKTFYNEIQSYKNGANAWNALEDMRIETLFVGEYPSVRPYFTSMFARYVLAEGKPASIGKRHMKTAYLLAYGRQYLGRKVINALRAKLTDKLTPGEVLQAQQIITRYNDLVPDDDMEAARVLIKRFADILSKTQDDIEQGSEVGNHCGQLSREPSPGKDDGPTRRMRVSITKAARDAAPGKSADDYDKEDQERQDKGQGSDQDGGKDPSDSDGSGQTPQDGQGTKGKGGNDASDDASGSDGRSGRSGHGKDGDKSDNKDSAPGGESDAPGRGHGGSGTSGGDESDRTTTDVGADATDLLKAAISVALADVDVQAAVRNAQHQIKHAPIKLNSLDQYPHTQPIINSLVPIVNKLRTKFERLRADVDPGWHIDNPAGKLSVKRAMRSNDVNTVFDAWDVGNMDASSIELVVLLDHSGSMSRQVNMLGPAAWLIKRACDRLDISCTIMTYGTASYVVYKAREAASSVRMPKIGSNGGTSPGRALVESHQIFSTSKQKYKLFIVMTDGQWDQNHRYEQMLGFSRGHNSIIESMNNGGVVTAMLYLDTPSQNDTTLDSDDYWHFCKVRVRDDNLMTLVSMTNKMVMHAMKNG